MEANVSTDDILKDAAASMGETTVAAEAVNIPLDKIGPNPFQPRKYFDQATLTDLAKTIKSGGVKTPITVRRSPNPESAFLFEICAGERRFRASGIAGLKVIPAFIKDYDNSEMRREGLLENIQREDLNFVDTVFGYAELRQDYKTAEGVAEQVGKDKSTVAKYFKLHEAITKLPDISEIFLNDASTIEDKEMKVDRKTAEGYAKIVGNLEKLAGKKDSGKNLNEYERIVRRLKKDGLKKSIPGLLLKFAHNKKEPADDTLPEMVLESDKHITLHIQHKKGEPVTDEMLAAFDEGFNSFRQRIVAIGPKEN